MQLHGFTLRLVSQIGSDRADKFHPSVKFNVEKVVGTLGRIGLSKPEADKLLLADPSFFQCSADLRKKIFEVPSPMNKFVRKVVPDVSMQSFAVEILEQYLRVSG